MKTIALLFAALLTFNVQSATLIIDGVQREGTITITTTAPPATLPPIVIKPTPSATIFCGTDANKLDSGILSNRTYTNLRPGLNYQTRMDRGQSAAFEFNTGNTTMGSLILEMSNLGNPVMKFVRIGHEPCNFNDYKGIDSVPFNGCATSDPLPVIRYTVGYGVFASCSLEPNTTYYLNVRNEYALDKSKRGIDTCQVGDVCAFLFQYH